MSKKKCTDGRKNNIPPAKHQFQPGQSGNPKGRPKKDRLPTRQEMLQQLFGKDRSVRFGDKVEKVTNAEAFINTVFASALKGDRYAIRLVDKWMSELDPIIPNTKEDTGGVLVVKTQQSVEEWVKNARKLKEEMLDNNGEISEEWLAKQNEELKNNKS